MFDAVFFCITYFDVLFSVPIMFVLRVYFFDKNLLVYSDFDENYFL